MRIYFASSDWDGADWPTNSLCYWDSETGQITAAYPALWDLGAGLLERKPDGGFVVATARYYHYVNPASLQIWGDWWQGGGGQVEIATDTILYELDDDLQNPEILLNDATRDSSPEGWFMWDFLPGNNYWDDAGPRVHMGNNELIVAGNRYREWTTPDQSEGESVHRYTLDGTLIDRSYPRNGYYSNLEPAVANGNYLQAPVQWSFHDRTRNITYALVDYISLLRVNHDTGAIDFAPEAFPWVQTLGGQWSGTHGDGELVRYDAGPSRPNGSAPYLGYSYEYDIFRSRKFINADVDETTGHIWALVNAYWPSGAEYCTNRPIPAEMPAHPNYNEGGDYPSNGIRPRYAAVCFDPGLLDWFPTYDNAAGFNEIYESTREFYRPDIIGGGVQGGNRRRGGPPQRQAEIDFIELGADPFYFTDLGGGSYDVMFHDPMAFTVQDGKLWFSNTVKVDEYYGPEGVYGIYTYDLATGQTELVFADDRRSTHPDDVDPANGLGYLTRFQMWQVIPVSFGYSISGEYLGARRAFARA